MKKKNRDPQKILHLFRVWQLKLEKQTQSESGLDLQALWKRDSSLQSFATFSHSFHRITQHLPGPPLIFAARRSWQDAQFKRTCSSSGVSAALGWRDESHITRVTGSSCAWIRVSFEVKCQANVKTSLR